MRTEIVTVITRDMKLHDTSRRTTWREQTQDATRIHPIAVTLRNLRNRIPSKIATELATAADLVKSRTHKLH